MRAAETIQAEIDTLKAMKPNVRQMSGFGDNHHDAIDAQVDVLENRTSWGDACDKYDPTDDDDINTDEGRSDSVRDAACDAASWMAGENEDKPSDGWKELVK